MQQERRLSIPFLPSGEALAPVVNERASAAIAPKAASKICIGVLNTSAYYNEDDIRIIMESVIGFWGMPDKILLPLDGKCSAYIDSWVERNTNITIAPVDAEWGKYGNKACMMRQKKIEQEATHFLIIRSPRAKSDKILYRAEALCKSDKEVLLVSGHDTDKSLIIDHYEVEEPPVKTKQTAKGKSNAKNLNKDIRTMMGIIKP